MLMLIAVPAHAADQPQLSDNSALIPKLNYPPPCQSMPNDAQDTMCVAAESLLAYRDQVRWAKWGFYVSAAGVTGLVISLFFNLITTRAAVSASKTSLGALQAAKRSADAAEQASHVKRA